jgi:formylglycine-generating enzyme required for sulfatase activity
VQGKKLCPQLARIESGELTLPPNSGNLTKIIVPAFEIGKFEVTTDQYNMCLDDKVCKERGNVDTAPSGNYPIANITWMGATTYAEWVSQKTGLEFRLPNIVEWTFAAKTSLNYLYPWGNDFEKNLANCGACHDEEKRVQPIGNSGPYNQLYDMIGNVAEMTSSCAQDEKWWDTQPDYGKKCNKHFFKGGDFASAETDANSDKLNSMANDFSSESIGFRLVKVHPRK